MEFMKAIRVVNSATQVDLYRISSDTKTYTEQALDSKDEIEV